MSPSTLHTSRFSFFCRETNLALAPCSTASTRAIESFQRNPNGGTNSSAARACCAEKTKTAISPIKKIWRIIGWFGRVTHVETRLVVSVLVACIYNLLSVCPLLGRREIARTGQFGQLGIGRGSAANSVRRVDSESSLFGLHESFSTHCFCFRADTRASFFQSRKFFCRNRNLNSFFSCRFRN